MLFLNVEPIPVSCESDVVGNDSKGIDMEGDDDEAPQDVSLAFARQQAVQELHQLHANQQR